MHYTSDQEIVEKAGNGDVQAFRQLVERHQAFVYRVAYRFVGNVAEAEDVTQECFIRLWKNLHRYRRDIKLTTWLYKIATNLCLDFLKSRQNRTTKRMLKLDDYGDMPHVSPADQPLIDAELRIAVDALISALSPKQKAVFVLRDMEQVEMSEIAEILGMDSAQVKSNLYYARKKVSEMVTSYYQIRKEAKS
ncbi:MAG TPA: RNA polymerase sigma factor [Chryseosolibacter sp.]|nr:RNA polymerase sigma factor [Chryseosolibacter sp.]